MHCRAVIFDLDGTLLDTLADIANSANAVLSEQGFPTHPHASYRQFVGNGVQALMSLALPMEVQLDAVIDGCARRFAEIYADHWRDASQPYAGIDELLAELRRRQLPLAVLSNKPQRFTEQCVHAFFADIPWVAILGQREHVPRKPDPAGALEIAALTRVLPRACVYVGDSSVDMETATRAGMLPVGVAWGFRSAEELQAHGAQWILHHPRELLELPPFAGD